VTGIMRLKSNSRAQVPCDVWRSILVDWLVDVSARFNREPFAMHLFARRFGSLS
jgi:hypothetical protein